MLGSFLIFIGVMTLSWNYLLKIKDQIYSDMKIAMMDDSDDLISHDVINDAPVAENVSDSDTVYEVDYSKYLGVLEIPRIGLKRGFYNTDSRYNNIQYNVMMVPGSTLPDVVNGNLILMAHSGDAYISYFAYLWRLNVGDSVFVTYGGHRYQYIIVDIYESPKGLVTVKRNYDRTVLTMITCTKNNDFTQTVYISELVG